MRLPNRFDLSRLILVHAGTNVSFPNFTVFPCLCTEQFNTQSLKSIYIFFLYQSGHADIAWSAVSS